MEFKSLKSTFRCFDNVKSAHGENKQQICLLKPSLPCVATFLGTLRSVRAIMPLSSVCVCAHATHLSQVMMNALPSPRSRQLGERVNKHNKLLLWVYSLGPPSLPVRPQPPAQGLTHKHQSGGKKKPRWKCVNSRFSFFVSVSLVKTCSSPCGSCEPAVLMRKACGVGHTMTCTTNKHCVHAHAAAFNSELNLDLKVLFTCFSSSNGHLYKIMNSRTS